MRAIARHDIVLKHEPTDLFVGPAFALVERDEALVVDDGVVARQLLARHAPMPHFVVVTADDDDGEAAA